MSYKVEIDSLKNCVVEQYDRRKKKVVWFYKLKSNQLICKIIDNEDPYMDYEFSYIILKYPYRPSIYLDSALVNLEEEIIKKINEYKRLFPKRKNALITIYKINNEVNKNEYKTKNAR